MNTLIVENLRNRLRQRIDRFDNADETDTLYFRLIWFWNFFNSNPVYVGIAESLVSRFPSIDEHEHVDRIFKGQCVWEETEEQAAVLGYKVLQRLVDEGQDAMHQLSVSAGVALHKGSATQRILEFFLYPLYYYVDEQLDNQGVMLSLLMRYKHRTEWFYRKQLSERCQETDEPKARNEFEKPLALDLYAYLYDQGIDFQIEPSSIPGEIDLIAAQDSDDPLLLDVKVFDNKNRNKRKLCEGFNQIYSYTDQYNEPCGYLVIYDITEEGLCFRLKCLGHMPMVVHNNKTIFLLTINIHPCPRPPSKRGVLKPIVITEDDLVRALE